MLERAPGLGADVVIADLEDAVEASARPQARVNIVRAFTAGQWATTTRAVRVNPIGEGGLRDLDEVVTGAGRALDLVVVPKVESAADVQAVAAVLAELEREVGREDPIPVEALVETAAGLAAVQDIAGSHPRLEAVTLGFGDLAASLGMPTEQLGEVPGYPGDGWHHVRMSVVVAARAAGIEAVDGPVARYDDLTAVSREAALAASLGMAGKWVIHPAQIAACRDAFTPTADQYARALATMDVVARGHRAGAGAATLSGAMVDAASVRMAAAVVARYERMLSD